MSKPGEQETDKDKEGGSEDEKRDAGKIESEASTEKQAAPGT